MENDIHYKSRTQIKKEAEELQKLGEALVKLSKEQLRQMNLPHDLLEALLEAQTITSHIAGRRQRQYLGSLMREVDPEPIRQALMQIETGRAPESEESREKRIWAEKLLTGEAEAIDGFVAAHPAADRQKIRQLLRNINKEQTAGKKPKSLKNLKQHIAESINNK